MDTPPRANNLTILPRNSNAVPPKINRCMKDGYSSFFLKKLTCGIATARVVISLLSLLSDRFSAARPSRASFACKSLAETAV